MKMSLTAALIEADVEAACDRIGLDRDAKLTVLARHRADSAPLLPYCVVSFAMLEDRADPDRDLTVLKVGLADYIETITNPAARSAWPLPWPDMDWAGLLIGQCDKLGLSDADAEYVCAAFDRDRGTGRCVLGYWVELIAAKHSPEIGYERAVRIACKSFARSLLWLRDQRPTSLPLCIYADAA